MELDTATKKIRALALSIAQCDEIARACHDRQHPCHKIVTSQREFGAQYRHIPEAWAGNLQTAKILFLSSNPSISTPKVSGTGEDYPLGGYADPRLEHPQWPESRIADFQTLRLDQTRDIPFVNTEAQFLCLDGKYRGSDNEKGTRTSQKYWKAAMTQARALLGEQFDISTGICMTEVVHCKSKREQGVSHASGRCSEKYLPSIFELSGAQLVLVGGAKARDRVHDNRHFWSTELDFDWQIDQQFGFFRRSGWQPRDHVGLVIGYGQSRIVIATEQLSYASNKFRYVEKVIGKTAFDRLVLILESTDRLKVSSRDDLLQYLGL